MPTILLAETSGASTTHDVTFHLTFFTSQIPSQTILDTPTFPHYTAVLLPLHSPPKPPPLPPLSPPKNLHNGPSRSCLILILLSTLQFIPPHPSILAISHI